MQATQPSHWFKRLASSLPLPLINPHKHPCEGELLSRWHLRDYIARGYVPWRMVHHTLVVAAIKPNEELKRYLERRYEVRVTLVYMTARDIRTSLEQHFGAEILSGSLSALRDHLPALSAAHTLSSPQRWGIAAALSIAATLLLLAPNSFLVAALFLMNGLYLLTLGFKWQLYREAPEHLNCPPPNMPLLNDSALPIYSVLVPLYREAASVSRLIGVLSALDYPKDKLDIKLVIEEDDALTWQAIQAARPPSYFDVIHVPASNPRTKPKACNYALHFARGEFVTIYDAEDAPEPQQLRKAASMFRASPQQIACLQARLNYYNADENLLTRCFAIEYASLFDITLPALERLGVPIPLGGTSNHIRTRVLRELHQWDPYNVTEDADLGMRLALHGYRTRLLNSVTLEEAPVHFMAWMRQRSRWIKGFLQTWLVYMRRPLWAWGRLGSRAFIGFQLMIGLPCLVFLLSPFMWLLSALWLAGLVTLPAAKILLWACLGIFAAGYLCHYRYARRCIARWRWQKMRLASLLYPFYWFCHSLAAFKAFGQLLHRPHYWEKTDHQQSRLIPEASPAAKNVL